MSKAKTAVRKAAPAPEKKAAALPETAGAMPWLSAHEVKKESNNICGWAESWGEYSRAQHTH